MGSNQQRQAVPLIKPESPIVGTGLESIVAHNTGQLTVAEEDGVVEKATADEVVVNYKKSGKVTYHPVHFMRSNEAVRLIKS